jgi:hypothetical protein
MIRSWHAATDCIWLFIPLFLDPARFKAQVLTGLPGSIFFFLNQNDVVLVKRNKSQRVATRFLTKSCRVTPGFFFSYFFFNPARF